MENSLGSTIEKIKRDEQNKEAKLKAKRELEAAKAALDRSFRDVVVQVRKMQQDKMDLIRRTDELHAQVTIQKIRRDALTAQLATSNEEMETLKAETEHSSLELQDLRSTYCQTMQAISDECDVWALLTKPSVEAMPKTIVKKLSKSDVTNENLVVEQRLKNAKERLDRAIAERERLNAEPETGDEFVRIKNALRYSLEMTANLRK